MPDSHRYLNGIEFGSVFRKSLRVSQVHKKFTTTNESHDEEDLLICHENIAHSHEERVVCLQQNILFKFGGLNLIVINDYVLAEGLHSVDLAAIFLLHQKYFTKATSSNNFFNLEVGQGNVVVSVFSKSWLALKRSKIVINIRRGSACSRGTRFDIGLDNSFIDVFTLVPATIRWHLFDSIFDLLFGCGKVLKVFCYIKYRQVLVHLVEIHSLDLQKKLVSFFADESVVVLVFHVDYKLHVFVLSATG